MIRRPAVAGQFYPGSKEHLEGDVGKYLSTGAKPRKVIGIIAPHAGYMYSGHVAGAVFAASQIPERVIVLSPNHTGIGAPAAIMSEGEWAMPMGNVKIDSELASTLVANCDELTEDASAHMHEHSLEVELPFLQALQPKLTFVPITVSHLRFDICEKIGKAIAGVLASSPTSDRLSSFVHRNILLVASSDMTHYEPHEVAKGKDKLAIDKVIKLDAKGLLDVCARERITMCGVIPASIMLIAARELGATKGELIKYATSGDTSGDYSSVVGYAGVIVY